MNNSERQPLTPLQIENWRRILIHSIGPYALIMLPEEIEALRDKIEQEAPQEEQADDDYDEYYCWHKVPCGPGPYCTGCGGLIKPKTV
jgi:hypothetical protein